MMYIDTSVARIRLSARRAEITEPPLRVGMNDVILCIHATYPAIHPL